jgi:hypothetical protein
MKINFIGSIDMPLSASIKELIIRKDGEFDKKLCLCLHTPFELKDAAKAWAAKHGGSWHPVSKVWYAPLKKSTAKDLIQSLFSLQWLCKGESIDFYAPNQKMKDFVLKLIPSQQEIAENYVIYNEFSVFPEQEAQYNSHPLFNRRGNDIPQMQGYVKGEKGTMRVVIFAGDLPEKWREKDLIDNAPRLLQNIRGESVWCWPWIDPTISGMAIDLSSWSDIENQDESHEDLPIEKPQVVAELKAGIVDGEIKSLIWVTIAKNLAPQQFHILKNWVKQWKSAKWIPEKKYWQIPVDPVDPVDKHKEIKFILDDLLEFDKTMHQPNSFTSAIFKPNQIISISDSLKTLCSHSQPSIVKFCNNALTP